MAETPPTARKLSDLSLLKPAALEMPDCAEKPQQFPDFAKEGDVHLQYTIADLQVILLGIGLSLTGDKKDRVALVCEHATIQVTLLDKAAVEDLTDSQVISALPGCSDSRFIARHAYPPRLSAPFAPPAVVRA
eukprot:2558185-Rhodomonas_salina.1